MSKQFWALFAVGLAVVAAAVAAIWSSTKSAHLELDGKILKVRSLPLGDGSALVVVDFRVTNPSGVPLVVSDVSMKMERYREEPLDGLEVSKPDVDTMFEAHPLLQPKYNDVLAPPDTIAPGKTIDRMAEASFAASQSSIDFRKDILLHIEDVDGASFDIVEKK